MTYQLSISAEQLHNMATVAVLHYVQHGMDASDVANMAGMLVRKVRSQYRTNANFRRCVGLVGAEAVANRMLALMPKVEGQYYDEIVNWLGERIADYAAGELGIIDYDGDHPVHVPASFSDSYGRDGHWNGQTWLT
jgi:hypothetical protein